MPHDTSTSDRPQHSVNGHRHRRRRVREDGEPPRVAFYTIVSHDSDPNPHATVMNQYAARRAALGRGQVRVVFFDITGDEWPHCGNVTAITRDGGLADLIVEAVSPRRRFDYLVTPGLAWLDRHGVAVLDLLRHLHRADVAYVVSSRQLPDELAYLIACDLLDDDR